MISRATHLYILSLISFFHRLRFDFAREVVIGLCFAVLGALFYYIFNDFLHTQALDIPATVSTGIGRLITFLLLSVVSIASGHSLSRERRSLQSLARCALRMGEKPSTLRLYWALRVPTVLAITYLPSWYLCLKSFIDLSWPALASCTLLMLATSLSIALGSSCAHSPTSNHLRLPPFLLKPRKKPSTLYTLVLWKMHQLLWRHRLAQLCLLLSFALGFLLLLSKGATPIEFLFALASGLLASFALSFQISQDLNCSWIEKNLGVSHQTYLASLIVFSHTLGGGIALLNFLFSLFAQGLQGRPNLVWALTLLFITWTPSFLLPFLSLQIDGRRPAIQGLSVTLTSLFIATAVYASLFSLLLFPLVAYYGIVSQKGRFYRA